MKSTKKTTLLSYLVILFSLQLNAQTNTWIGGDDDWAIDANWSLNHVPLNTEDVILPGGSVVGISSLPAAEALTLVVQNGAVLTLKAGTELKLEKAGATQNRIRNFGSIFNQGIITLSSNDVGNIGIENSGSNANFINEGNIDVLGYEGANIHGIQNSFGAHFENTGTGDIDILNGNNTSSGSGIDNKDNNTEFINDGSVTISNIRNGITNTFSAYFENNDELYLGDVKWDAGIENLTGATFYNKANGYITLEELNNVAGIEGVYNAAIFINDGDFEIISPSGEGVDNRGSSGIFENNGTLDISGVQSTYGVVNTSSGTFVGTGTINSDKPFYQNSKYSTFGPNIINWNCALTLNPSAKDTMIVNSINAGPFGSDVINVDGDLVLNGELIVKTTNGYMPNLTDQFTLFLVTGAISGSFSSLTLPPGFTDFEITVSNGKVILKNPICVVATNSWIGGYGGKWDDDGKWSLGHMPEICENVIINTGDSVEMNAGNFVAKQLTINGVLNIQSSGAYLEVNGQSTTDIGIEMNDGILINKGHILIQDQYGFGAVSGLSSFQGEIVNHGLIQIQNVANSGGGQFNSAFRNTGPVKNFGEIEIQNVDVTCMRVDGPFVNEGDIVISNGNDGAGLWTLDEFTNASGGTIDISNMLLNDGLLISINQFSNFGQIQVDNTQSYGVSISPSGTLNNNGTIEVAQTGFANVICDIASKITGTGTFNLDQRMTMEGEMSPGNSPGIIAINGRLVYTPNHSSTFEIAGNGGPGELDGHDQVISDTLILAGTLNIELLNEFIPSFANQFKLFEYSDIMSGTFSSVNLPASISDWEIDYTMPNQIILKNPACTFDTNVWIGGDGKWSIVSNWSLGHEPTPCEHVEIGNSRIVEVNTGFNAVALSIFVDIGSTLLIESSAILSIDMNRILTRNGIENHGLVINQGEVNIRNGKQSSGIRSISAQLTNSGLITVSDIIEFNAKGIQNSINSTFTNEASGVVQVFDLEFASASTVSSSTGSSIINHGLIEGHRGGSIVVITGGSLDNYGTITNDSVQSTDFVRMFADGIFQNHSGAQLILSNGVEYSSKGIDAGGQGTIFINDGNIDIDNVGFHGVFFDDNALLTNNGTIDMTNTGVTLAQGKDMLIDGATYQGDGEAYGTNEIVFDGKLLPGNSPGYLYFEGDVTLGSSNLDTFEIGGTAPNQYDQLYVLDGDLTLAGLMVIDLINGFVPADTDVFEIMEYDGGGTLIGDFFLVLFPAELTGWELDYSVQGKVRLIKPACTAATNSWIGTSPNFESWTDGTKWSLGHEPRYCEDIVIGTGDNVVIEDLTFAAAHSIDVNGGMLHVNPIGFLNIDVDQDSKTGLRVRNSGSFANYGDINIFGTNGFNADGASNDASSTFLNGIGSELNIYDIAGGNADGFFNIGSMTNEGDINIHNVVHANGLISSLAGSNFENKGNITIRDIDDWGLSIFSNGTFTQTDMGTLLIEDCGSLRLNMTANAIFTLGGIVQLK